MNEQVKKILKASFCPKEKWVKDDSATNCFKCDKKFHALYRRKHHCRYCGQVFCATCSDFYLSGKDLGQADKPIRMCEADLQKCWKYIAKHDDTYIKCRTSGEIQSAMDLPSNINEIQMQSKASSFSEQDRLKQIQSIIEEYEGSVANGIKKLQKQVDVKFAILLQVILKQAQIPLAYLPQISAKVKEIVQRLPPNFVVAGRMNICPNLRIKGFYGQKFQTFLEPNVIIKKKFNNKKIKDQYQNCTCILVYGGIQAEDMVGMDRQASFENMVNNRLKQMNKIIGYCQRVHVNMIFLEGVIEKEFEDMLVASDITVIPKVKVQYLSRLKSAIKIQKIVEAISKVYCYPQKEITGFIKRMTSFSYVSVKEGNLTKKFFKVWTAKDELGLTLVIQAPTAKILDSVKAQVKFAVQALTHLKLKVYKVRMDEGLLESMTEQMRNDCYLNNSQMFFSFYSQFHSDFMSIIKQKYVSYKHISYVQSDFSSYPQVNKPSVDDYLRGRTHAFKAKWQNFTEICGQIHDQHRMFYSEQDVPLGGFLLKRLTGIDKKCVVCGKPNYLHIQVFYSTDQYVKVWAQSMIIDTPEQSNMYSSFASQADSVNQGEMEMIFTYLEKNANKQKLKCFIQCFDCGQPISTRQNVYKSDLEYSTLCFMQHMFKGSTETTIRQNNTRKTKVKSGTCPHSRKTRVFELGSKSVKFFVGKYTINRQCILTPTGKDLYLRRKEAKAITEVCMLQSARIDRLMGYLYDQIKSIAEMSKNSKFDTIIKNPRSSFIKARKSVLGAGNVRLSQAQCVDMIVPQLIEEVSKVSNIAQVMLNIKRIGSFLQGLKTAFLFLSMLKRCYLIISEVKKSVKKRELQQKYQVQDFQNEYILQDVDINAYADAVSSIDSESSDMNSDTSRSDQISNMQTLDTALTDIEYGWLQPYTKEQMSLSRQNSKTQSNILAKKSIKMTEQQAYKLFKTVSSALKIQQENVFIPCFPNRPQSMIAAALNSRVHKDCIGATSAFTNQLTIKITNYMDYDVPLVDNEDIRKLFTLIQTQERMFDIHSKFKKEGASTFIQIQMLYPNQFQVLRRKKGLPLDLFISSLAGADNWLTSGGKSGSPFMRSYNDLLVIKKVPKGEFMAFRKFLPGYFTHLHQGSILTPIYGAFVVNRGTLSSTDYCIVMQNLFFGMKQWHIYDFKGSVTRRFSRPPVIPLDINFLIDRHSQPIFAKENVLKNLSSTLDYLCENNVIDYSLILVVEIENADQQYYLEGNRFQIGIVDYMREFGAGQWVQNKWKGAQATVVEPQIYKKRMLKNLKRYFTQIPL